MENRLLHFSVALENQDQSEQLSSQRSNESPSQILERKNLGDQLKSTVSGAHSSLDWRWDSSWENFIMETSLSNIKTMLSEAKKARGKSRKIEDTKKFDELLQSEWAYLSEGARNIYEKLKAKYQKGSDRDNEAFGDFVANQVARLAPTKAAFHEYDKLAGLPGIDKICQNISVSVTSKTGVSKTLNGWISRNELRGLSLDQKQKYFDEIRKTFSENKGDSSAVNSLKNKFLHSQDVPDSWKKWLEDPQNSKWEGGPKPLGYVVNWVEQNLPALKVSVARYQNLIESNQHSLRKASVVPYAVSRFREMSRSERNTYLDQISGKIAEHDEVFAQKMHSAEVSDGDNAQLIKNDQETSAKKEDADFDQAVLDFGKKAEKSTLMTQINQAAREEENMINEKNQPANEADSFANLRARQENDQNQGFWSTMKTMIGLNRPANDNENEKSYKVENKQLARIRAVDKTLRGNTKNQNEAAELLGLKDATRKETLIVSGAILGLGMEGIRDSAKMRMVLKNNDEVRRIMRQKSETFGLKKAA